MNHFEAIANNSFTSENLLLYPPVCITSHWGPLKTQVSPSQPSTHYGKTPCENSRTLGVKPHFRQPYAFVDEGRISITWVRQNQENTSPYSFVWYYETHVKNRKNEPVYMKWNNSLLFGEARTRMSVRLKMFIGMPPLTPQIIQATRTACLGCCLSKFYVFRFLVQH